MERFTGISRGQWSSSQIFLVQSIVYAINLLFATVVLELSCVIPLSTKVSIKGIQTVFETEFFRPSFTQKFNRSCNYRSYFIFITIYFKIRFTHQIMNAIRQKAL